jgi:hypothetical protein
MSTQAADPTSTSQAYETVTEQVRRGVPVRSIKTLAFWLAVTLPFLHVPLLVAGVSSPARFGAYLGLLAVNVLALAVGHDHRA